MRCAPLWTLALVLGFSTTAWAQFGGGGGGFGGGEMMGGGMGGGMGVPGMGGFEMAAPAAQDGINAYRAAPGDAGKFQVIWTGPHGEASQQIAAKLHQETKIQFVETPLQDVVAYLQNLHEIPIQVDQAELDRSGIDRDITITVNIESLSLPVALDLMTKQHDLGWYIDGGALVITSYDDVDSRLSNRIYKLNQLDAVGAAKVVTKVIFPESWSEQGGHANMAVIRDRNLLVIRQNREGHDAIESLLTQLEQLK